MIEIWLKRGQQRIPFAQCVRRHHTSPAKVEMGVPIADRISRRVALREAHQHLLTDVPVGRDVACEYECAGVVMPIARFTTLSQDCEVVGGETPLSSLDVEMPTCLARQPI